MRFLFWPLIFPYLNIFPPRFRVLCDPERVNALCERVEPFEFPQGSTLSPPEGRVEWVEGLCLFLLLCPPFFSPLSAF
jgi:hypothetical protein